MKTTTIKGKPIATFDDEIMRIIDGKETTMRQVEKEHMLIGIRNEHQQLYRAIGITGFDLYSETLDKLENAGFIDELNDKPPKKGYDAILNKT